mgnify:CR=1 FL=1
MRLGPADAEAPPSKGALGAAAEGVAAMVLALEDAQCAPAVGGCARGVTK